jgi:hypothetical protein
MLKKRFAPRTGRPATALPPAARPIPSDLGGIPRTLDSGPAAQGLGQDSAEADMTIDAGPGRQAASQTGRADAAAGSAEPQAEKPEEQLARPTKDGTATQRDINDA